MADCEFLDASLQWRSGPRMDAARCFAAAVAPPATSPALPAAPTEKRPVSAAPGETVSVEPKKKRLTPVPNPSPN